MTMHNAHLIVHGYIGPGSHKALIPPAVVPVMTFHIAADTLLGLTIKAKYSNTELGSGGIQLVARNNDSGYVVPHISIPPNNVLLPVTIALGQSKVLFGSSKTLINAGGAQQCGACAFPAVPLSLNMACNDPCNYPSDIVIAPHNVEVGLTLGDIMMGIFAGVVDAAISFAMGWAAGKLSGAVVNAVCRNIAGKAFWELAGDFGVESARRMVNDMAENLAERAAAQIADKLLGEAAKVGMESVVDAGLSASGVAQDRDQLYQDSGYFYAGQAGEGPARNPQIYTAP